jgi:small-conductance mechanosensitive channel
VLRRLALRAAAAWALLLAAPAAAGAQQPPPAAGTIAVPEIAQRADAAASFLREVEGSIKADPELEAIAQKLPDARDRLNTRLDETRQLLAAQPDLARLDALSEAWRARRVEFLKWMDLVTARATQLEGAIARVRELRATWRRALADARSAQAPAPLIDRVNALLADIDALDGPLQVQRAAVLVLQDKVAREVTRCEDALALVDQARSGAAHQLFARDTPPIWSAESRAHSWGDLAARVHLSVSTALWELHDFFTQRAGRLLLQGIVFVLLALAARAVRRQIPSAEAAEDDDARAVARAFAHPLAAAFLITVITTYWVYPLHARPLRNLIAVAGLAPVVLVVKPIVAPAMHPWLWILGALVVIDRIRDTAALTPALDQGPLLVETLLGIIATGWFLRWCQTSRDTGRAGRIEMGARLFLAVFVLAFGANAIGYVALAELLAGGVLRAAYQLLTLLAAVQVASGLVAYARRSAVLQSLWMVRQHGARLERRARTALRWLAVACWLAGTLEYFLLLQPAVKLLRAVLTAEVRRGTLSISLGDVLAFALAVWLSFLVSSFVRFVLQEDVFPRIRLAPGLPYAVSTLLHYCILFVGFLVGVAALGLDLNKVTVIGGALGVGIGFGLQSVVNNFVSGLIVLFERPVRVGDSVQIGDVTGDVRRIGIRATTLRTYDGAEVLIPNSMLVSERVTNWTLSDRARRADVRVGVAYGTAPERVLELLRSVARTTPHVAASPAPVAIFVGFGDSALDFELRAWTDRWENWLALRSELHMAVYAALRDAGIDIPFPQREVYLRGPRAAGDGAP